MDVITQQPQDPIFSRENSGIQNVSELDLWKEFLSHIEPHHRDDMAAERKNIDGYKSSNLNADAKLSITCFLGIIRRFESLQRYMAAMPKGGIIPKSEELGDILEIQIAVTETRKTLESLAPSIDQMNKILRMYGEMEAYRILEGNTTVFSNPEKAAREANTEELAHKITQIWNRNIKDLARWYDKPLATIPRKVWIFGFVLSTTIFVFLSSANSNRLSADRITKEADSLRQEIGALNAAHAKVLASFNERMGAPTQQTIPDVITYQESGGRIFMRLPDGTWKPVTFHNLTPAR